MKKYAGIAVRQNLEVEQTGLRDTFEEAVKDLENFFKEVCEEHGIEYSDDHESEAYGEMQDKIFYHHLFCTDIVEFDL